MNFLGRKSNNLSAGIVGLANIGKSTFFQNITHSKLGNPANYPFATIEPSHAITQIPNEKLDRLQEIYSAKKVTHSTLSVIDIAGLTKGAAEGKGLGNKFLNDIKLVDGLFHLVRAFKDDEITHLEQSVDPVRDLGLVQDELILKDLDMVESIITSNNKRLNSASKNHAGYNLRGELEKELHLFESLQDYLYTGQKIANFKYNNWTQDEINILNKYNFLTSKPSIILLNVDVEDYISGEYAGIKDVKQWRDEFAPHDRIIMLSNFECSNKDEKKSVLPRIIQEMKQMLHLISFYTAGPQEVRQWNIREGTTAKDAASVIHTDLQKSFIYAEITKYDDLVACKGNNKPHVQKVGKDYIMQDDDIVYFKATKGKN